jgi:hypothetical protein
MLDLTFSLGMNVTLESAALRRLDLLAIDLLQLKLQYFEETNRFSVDNLLRGVNYVFT